MPIENDVKEIDIEPPKPAMTYAQYIGLVQRREEIQHEKYLKMFSELEEQLRKNHEEAKKYHEEAQSRLEEAKKYQEENHKYYEDLNNRIDALIKDTESYLAKSTEQPEISLVKDNEPVPEIRELQEQVIELQAENEDLRNKICQLWELLTSFFRKKITPVTKGFNSFFSKSNKPLSPDTSIEVQNNSSTNGC